MSTLQGFDAMVRRLDTLKDKSTVKLGKAGVNAGLGALAKSLRAAVNAAPVSSDMKKAARATISKRLKKKEGQPTSGKAGFAVGKRSKAKKEKAIGRSYAGSLGTARGVGISASNVHWPVFGTQDRRTASGRATGKMPSLLGGLVKQASATAGPAMLEAARKKVTQVLAAEASKLRKGS